MVLVSNKFLNEINEMAHAILVAHFSDTVTQSGDVISKEVLTQLITEIAVLKMKNLDEYKPIFNLIDSLEKDVTDSCVKGLEKYVEKQKKEISNIKTEENIKTVRQSIEK